MPAPWRSIRSALLLGGSIAGTVTFVVLGFAGGMPSREGMLLAAVALAFIASDLLHSRIIRARCAAGRSRAR